MAIKLEKEIKKQTRPEKQKKPRKKKKQEKKNLEKQKQLQGNKIQRERKIEPEKQKMAKRRFGLGETVWETIGFVVLMAGMFFFILTFILWGVSELIEENFIMSEIVGAYCGASMCLCFGLVFIGLIIMIGNWFGKLVFLLFAGVMLSVSYDFIETSVLLYKDKSAYENQKFETLVATPTGQEYDDADHGPEYVMELEFKNLTIDIYNLDITRNYYEKNLYGKQLEIEYLPNSHFAVSVKKYGDVSPAS